MLLRTLCLAAALTAAVAGCDPASKVDRKLDKVGEKAADAVERDVDLAVKQDVARRAQVHDQAKERAEAGEKEFDSVDAAARELKDAVLEFHEERAETAADQSASLNKAEEKLKTLQADVSAGKKKVKAGYDASVATAQGALARARAEVAGLAAVDVDDWKPIKARAENAVDAADDAVDDVGHYVD